MRYGTGVWTLAVAVGLLAPRCLCRTDPDRPSKPACAHCPAQGTPPSEGSSPSPAGCPNEHCGCHADPTTAVSLESTAQDLLPDPFLQFGVLEYGGTAPRPESPRRPATWEPRGPPPSDRTP